MLTRLDLILLFAYLMASAGLGALFYRRKSTSNDYLFAGRSVSWIPVSISILATDFSAITYLGMPAFVFQRDLQSFPIPLMLCLVIIPVVQRWIAPFYRRLNPGTAYEYLERRFDIRVRLLISFVFLGMRGIYMGIVIYAPSLVIAVVTGLPLPESVLLMGALTTAYTTLGGMRAVIWTDVLQFAVIVAGVTAIILTGVGSVEGGWTGVFAVTRELGKTKVADFAFDLEKEFTIWAVMIGSGILYLNTYGTDQVILQRYLTARSEADCRRALKLEAVMLVPVVTILQLTGLVLAAYYAVHPEEAAGIVRKDAVLPYFTVNHLPVGLRGLVIASIFAAAMSTVSGGINSLSTATLGDFYRRLVRKDANDAHYLRASRWLTVAWGIAATLMALLAGRLGELANAYNKVNSLLGGVIVGVFALGLLTRRARADGVLAGALAGFTAVVAVAALTKLSWLWYGITGLSATLAAGYAVSLAGPPPPAAASRFTLYARKEMV